MKKPSNLILLSFLFCFVSLASCSKDDGDNSITPITLSNITDSSIDLDFPTDHKSSFEIIGGDGNISVSCRDTSVLNAKLIEGGRKVELEVLGLGDAIVTIKDNSNNSYTLNVNVSYFEVNIKVDRVIVEVFGEGLTEEDKKDIEERALASIPVKVDGGYKFVYPQGKEHIGDATIYPNVYGENGIEECSIEFLRYGDEPGTSRYYNIKINGVDRTFILRQYQETRLNSLPMNTWAFYETITAMFKDEYPAVERVRTTQILSTWRNE